MEAGTAPQFRDPEEMDETTWDRESGKGRREVRRSLCRSGHLVDLSPPLSDYRQPQPAQRPSIHGDAPRRPLWCKAFLDRFRVVGKS